jgi:hypothetical protein
MLNITKLKCWPELQAMGFVPVRYSAHGKLITMGASLQYKLKSLHGIDSFTDIITIEANQAWGKDHYWHIVGTYEEPICIYKNDRLVSKIEFCSSYVEPKDILKTVKKLKKTYKYALPC